MFFFGFQTANVFTRDVIDVHMARFQLLLQCGRQRLRRDARGVGHGGGFGVGLGGTGCAHGLGGEGPARGCS